MNQEISIKPTSTTEEFFANSELEALPRKPFSLREEPFGYTFYDKAKLRYRFIKKDELEQTLREIDISSDNYDILSMKKTEVRDDILYSPIRIYYETTLRCNIRCQSCFNDSGKPRYGELTTEELIKSLHDLREANIMDVRFTGGELTRRPDWFLMLKTAKWLGFGVSCNTNGIYNDPEVPAKFAELDIDQVTISIDGRKGHHEFNRGPNTFDRTLASLQQMHALGVKLRINTLITKGSLSDARYMAELASQYATEINFFITRFVGRGRNFGPEQLVTFEEYYQMSQEAERLRKEFPNLNIIHFEGATIQNSSRSGDFDRLRIKAGPPDGTTRFNILSNGDLYAGGYIPYVDASFRLGNIKTDDIVEVWQKSEILEAFRDSSRKLEAHCAACPEYGKRCPGPNYELELLRKHDSSTRNPYCFYGDGPSLLTLID